MSSSPVELVAMLYAAAMDAAGSARQYLASGAIADRSRKITQAWEILQELRRSLHHDHAAELSSRLDALYAYMQERLIEANVQQTDAPLAEVQKYLTSLHDAWRAVEPAHPAEDAARPESFSVAC